MSEEKQAFEFGRDRLGKPRKYKSPAAFEFEVDFYFDTIDADLIPIYHKQLDRAGMPVKIPTKQPYTVEGLCLHLGITRQTLLNYEKEEMYPPEYQQVYRDFFDIIQRARMRITQQRVMLASLGVLDPNFTKFLLINTTDMVERSEQKVIGTHTNTNLNTEPMSAERIKEISQKLEDEC